MQVILDSLFARPGAAPIRGGKKREFRDWTKVDREKLALINRRLKCTVRENVDDYR